MLVTASVKKGCGLCTVRLPNRETGQRPLRHDLSCRFRDTELTIRAFSEGVNIGKIVNHGDFRKS
jgi:hypothetical protein